MKDAVGGSLLLNLVVFFTAVVILFFAGIMTYSKAYKVKNRIIEVIEKHGTYNTNAKNEINNDLTRIGYRVSSKKLTNAKCSGDSSMGSCTNLNTTTQQYCVCSKGNLQNGTSYEVITYVYFDFPVIGELIRIPVRGETKVLGKNYNY